MREWLKEALANYQFHIPTAAGSGWFIWIFIVCALLLLLWRNKDRIEKNTAGYLGVLLILVLNPFTVPIYNKIMYGDYWRTLWVLTVPVFIALCFTKLAFTIKMKPLRYLLVLALAFLIFKSGVFSYNEVNFAPAQNLYKVPQDVVEACDLIHENVEEPKLASPGEINFRVRQYDATILSESSRNNLGNDKLEALLNPEGTYDTEAIRKKALKCGCNCVVLRADKLTEEEPDGYRLIGTTGPANYHVYQLME
jgi:hypothetical protein